MWVRVLSIVPSEMADRLWKYSILLVDAFHCFGEAIDDIEVGAAVGDGLHCLVAPLCPASAVDDAAFLLDARTGRQNEDFGGNPSRIRARPLPEARSLVLEQIGDDHPIELIESRAYKTRIGAAHRGILAEAKQPFYLACEHGMGEREKSVALSLKSAAELRQVSEVELILARGVLAPPSFQQAHDVFRRVLQPVRACRIGRHRRHALQIALQVGVRF